MSCHMKTISGKRWVVFVVPGSSVAAGTRAARYREGVQKVCSGLHITLACAKNVYHILEEAGRVPKLSGRSVGERVATCRQTEHWTPPPLSRG